MDVYGIDPSLTCTGLAKTTSAGVILTHRVKTSTTPDELGAIAQRIRYITAQVLQFAPAECLTVIEAPYVPQGAKSAGSVLERAWLFGFLADQLMRRGSIVRVRTTTRAMYATGSGNARKPEVLASMRAAFPAVEIPDDNVADALAMCAMGARWLGEPIDGLLSKKQEAAMVAVHWPEMKERAL